MWMQAVTFDDGIVVHAYKHVDTYRCLQLNQSGHACRESSAGGVRPLVHSLDARAAIAHVLKLNSPLNWRDVD